MLPSSICSICAKRENLNIALWVHVESNELKFINFKQTFATKPDMLPQWESGSEFFHTSGPIYETF